MSDLEALLAALARLDGDSPLAALQLDDLLREAGWDAPPYALPVGGMVAAACRDIGGGHSLPPRSREQWAGDIARVVYSRYPHALPPYSDVAS